MEIKITKVKKVKTPERGTPRSAGIDFFVPDEATPYHLLPGESALIPSGIKVEIPPYFALIAFNKSGVSTKKGLQVGACVVDEDYQGEVHLHLVNVSDKVTTISPGEKVLQFILVPVAYPTVREVAAEEIHLQSTQRGEGGFGSTDRGGEA
jgi:dUTP pyrophosphatase